MLLLIIILLAVIAVGLFGVSGVVKITFKLIGLGLALLVGSAAIVGAVVFAAYHPEDLGLVGLMLLKCAGLALVMVGCALAARYLRDNWRNYQRSRAIDAEVMRQNHELARIEGESNSPHAVMPDLDQRIDEDLVHEAKMENFRNEQRTMRAKGKWK